MGRVETLPNSFNETRINLIPQLNKDISRKLQTNIPHEYMLEALKKPH